MDHVRYNLGVTSYCPTCIHIGKNKRSCKAYPNGIPDKYEASLASHNQVDGGQSGRFIYEEKI